MEDAARLTERQQSLVGLMSEKWDLEEESECEDLAHCLLGALGALGDVWNPYAIIGLSFANCMHILAGIEEDTDE